MANVSLSWARDMPVRRINAISGQFYAKKIIFTKTGSGQTYSRESSTQNRKMRLCVFLQGITSLLMGARTQSQVRKRAF